MRSVRAVREKLLNKAATRALHGTEHTRTVRTRCLTSRTRQIDQNQPMATLTVAAMGLCPRRDLEDLSLEATMFRGLINDASCRRAG